MIRPRGAWWVLPGRLTDCLTEPPLYPAWPARRGTLWNWSVNTDSVPTLPPSLETYFRVVVEDSWWVSSITGSCSCVSGAHCCVCSTLLWGVLWIIHWKILEISACVTSSAARPSCTVWRGGGAVKITPSKQEGDLWSKTLQSSIV